MQGPDPTSSDASAAGIPDEYEAVQASVVPVPMETFNRLVLAVDRLAIELTTVQRAIRELTSILTDSLRAVDQHPSPLAVTAERAAEQRRQEVTAEAAPAPSILGVAPATSGVAPAAPDAGSVAPDPVAPAPTTAAAPAGTSPTGSSGSPDPVAPHPFAGMGPIEPFASFPLAPGAPPVAPVPRPAPAAPPASDPGIVPPLTSFDDVPLVSVGEVQVLLGPVSTLAELDDLDQRIRALHGVDDVSVTAFEGHEVLLTVHLGRPIPLASVLRTELGREVRSCRVHDGRVVVEFEPEPATT